MFRLKKCCLKIFVMQHLFWPNIFWAQDLFWKTFTWESSVTIFASSWQKELYLLKCQWPYSNFYYNKFPKLKMLSILLQIRIPKYLLNLKNFTSVAASQCWGCSPLSPPPPSPWSTPLRCRSARQTDQALQIHHKFSRGGLEQVMIDREELTSSLKHHWNSLETSLKLLEISIKHSEASQKHNLCL